MGDVGVIVNPWAGKDVRRLHAPAGHTSDAAKVATVRRVVVAALEAGATRVHIANDVGGIGSRAVKGLRHVTPEQVSLVDGPGTGSALDSRRAAGQLAELDCRVVVVLGGDGTCRDVVIGWPNVVMIAISTGTNNVFPTAVDATSAGTAAGFVASGAIDSCHVARAAKVLDVTVETNGGSLARDIALVDVALIDASVAGSRAVVNAASIKAVVAAIATPASTGLSSIAGRVRPLGRHDPGAVAIRLGGATRQVRVPLMPGSSNVLGVETIEHLDEGATFRMDGPGVLAYDGERDTVLSRDATAFVAVHHDGPMVIDVHRTLHCAARQQLFDVASTSEESNGA